MNPPPGSHIFSMYSYNLNNPCRGSPKRHMCQNSIFKLCEYFWTRIFFKFLLQNIPYKEKQACHPGGLVFKGSA